VPWLRNPADGVPDNFEMGFGSYLPSLGQTGDDDTGTPKG